MTIDEIKELLDLFNASGVGELEIEREGERIRIRKAGMVPEYQVSTASTAAVQPGVGDEHSHEETQPPACAAAAAR